jgi:pyruvate-formate lyase-activating enzyme
MDEYRHRELTGISNRLILDNLRRLDKAGPNWSFAFRWCPA